jgi:uncharacterized protein YdaU (DUF1376 family)
MYWYKKNIGDYAKKTQRLNMLQHGAYNQLMDACYDRERFPTLEEAIDWVWAISEEEIAAVKYILGRFFVLQDGIYSHLRIVEEIESYHAKADKNKQIASESWAKRKESDANRIRNASENIRVVCERIPKKEPLTNNHLLKPETPLVPPAGGKRNRATRLPEDLTPNQTAMDLADQLNVDLENEFRAFKDHALANGKVFIDWQAAIRTWIRNSVKFNKTNGANKNGYRERQDNDFRNTEELFKRARDARASHHSLVHSDENVIRLEDELGIFK